MADWNIKWSLPQALGEAKVRIDAETRKSC